MIRIALTCCVTVLSLSLGASSSLGAFNYGNFSGDNVVYQQVTEDSTTDPGVQLFGTPSIADDALLFNPVSFGASAGGGTFDITDGTLATTVQALNSSYIDKLQFAERGDYTLAGSGTSATSASVSAALFIRITHTDGGSITPVTYSTNMLFNPSDGTYNLINDPGSAVIWSGGVEVDLTAILLAAGETGKATKVDLTLDNQLLAFSESGTISYIKKKQAEGVSITAIIPEPATLLLIGVGGLFMARRRG